MDESFFGRVRRYINVQCYIFPFVPVFIALYVGLVVGYLYATHSKPTAAAAMIHNPITVESLSLSTALRSSSSNSAGILPDTASRELQEGGGIGHSTDEFASLDTVEEQFESTIRSCLGAKCFNELVHTPSGDIARIGFLTLPGSGGDLLFDFLQQFSTMNNNPKLELIKDTHVPAYGYGKNHGWSSIVRVSRRVVHHSHALLSKNGFKPTSDSLDNQVRQFVTWHCRLSHVAAHTRMLTVFIDQLYARPLAELEKLLTYIGLEFDRQQLVTASQRFKEQLGIFLHRPDIDKTQTTTATTSILSPTMYQVGLKAVREELESTHSLTDWPCKSFKHFEDPTIPMHTADLAANCSAPYVTCSVRFDTRGG